MGRNGGGYVFPADEEGVMGVSLAKKPAESRTWMLVDATGQEKTLEVDKYTIMRRVQIHARDLRIIDPFLSYPSAILGREKAIVLNLEHIKAIITAEEIWLQDPFNERLIPFLEQLRRQFKTVSSGGEADGSELLTEHPGENAEEDELTFEFKALEVALEAICSYLAARSVELELSIYPALDMLTSKISSKNLERLRKLKSKMTRLTARVQKVRDELEQLLDDDDDMADLYLSRKMASESSCASEAGANSYIHSPTIGSRISAGRVSMATIHDDENDVEELEMLLEAYFTQIDDTLNKLSTIREYVESTEDYINIQLDNHRNQLIQLELGLNLGTVCLAIYSLVAAIFGMNIPYTWNDDHGFMFKWVITVAGAFSGLLFISIMSYARHKGLIRFGL